MATIVIADDSPTLRRIVSSVLSKEGHEVIQSEDGISAVQAVFAGVDRAERTFDADKSVSIQRHSLLQRKKPLDERHATLTNQIAKISSPEIEALESATADAAAALADIGGQVQSGRAAVRLGRSDDGCSGS